MSNEQGFRGVPGVPDGWELVRIGIPINLEWVIAMNTAEPYQMAQDGFRYQAIVRKIEKPKQYRPFANAEEFKPHRDRWVRHIASDTCSKVIGYNDRSVKFGTNKGYWDYEMACETWVFGDGTPFGVECEVAG
jgi:hypothetical protein